MLGCDGFECQGDPCDVKAHEFECYIFELGCLGQVDESLPFIIWHGNKFEQGLAPHGRN